MNNLHKSVNSLQEILNQENPKKVFLVTGKESYDRLPKNTEIQDALAGYEILRYSDFSPNPTLEDIISGIKLLKAFQPDLILGIGGGSVMDMSKLLSVLPEDEKNIIQSIKGKLTVVDRILPLIVVPTTAGSGSEATHFAVAYIGDEKYSVASKSMLPDHVILDSSLTETMSSYLTAVTGLDAICQAIESWWAVGGTDESREYACHSLQKLISVFPDVVKNPTGEKRRIMMEGAYLAGKAINISKTTAPHAFSYILTKKYGLSHGHAVAMTIGKVAEFNFNASKDCLKKIKEEIMSILGLVETNEIRDYFANLLKYCGLETEIEAINGFQIKDKNYLIDKINIERLKNNPIEINKEELYNILFNK